MARSSDRNSARHKRRPLAACLDPGGERPAANTCRRATTRVGLTMRNAMHASPALANDWLTTGTFPGRFAAGALPDRRLWFYDQPRHDDRAADQELAPDAFSALFHRPTRSSPTAPSAGDQRPRAETPGLQHDVLLTSSRRDSTAVHGPGDMLRRTRLVLCTDQGQTGGHAVQKGQPN